MNPAGGNFTTQLTALNINSHRKCLIDLKSEDLYKYHIPMYLVLKIDFYSVSNACEFFSVKTTHLQSSGERAHRGCRQLLLVSIGLNLLESYASTMAEMAKIISNN